MNRDLGNAFDRIISDPSRFYFDRETVRKYRPVAGSPRDIVDSGEFLRSRMLFLNDDLAEHLWGVDYAMTILVGAARADGTYMPGRDWITETLLEFNLAQEMTKYL